MFVLFSLVGFKGNLSLLEICIFFSQEASANEAFRAWFGGNPTRNPIKPYVPHVFDASKTSNAYKKNQGLEFLNVQIQIEYLKDCPTKGLLYWEQAMPVHDNAKLPVSQNVAEPRMSNLTCSRSRSTNANLIWAHLGYWKQAAA